MGNTQTQTRVGVSFDLVQMDPTLNYEVHVFNGDDWSTLVTSDHEYSFGNCKRRTFICTDIKGRSGYAPQCKVKIFATNSISYPNPEHVGSVYGGHLYVAQPFTNSLGQRDVKVVQLSTNQGMRTSCGRRANELEMMNDNEDRNTQQVLEGEGGKVGDINEDVFVEHVLGATAATSVIAADDIDEGHHHDDSDNVVVTYNLRGAVAASTMMIENELN